MARSSVNDLVVRVHGQVSPGEERYARDKIAAVAKFAPGRVLHAKADLVRHADPAREEPAFAKAELDVNGQVVRAHATDRTVHAAIDQLEARMRRRLERIAERGSSRQLRHRDFGHWRHGDAPAPRPAHFPRPVEEREVVRRKTFALGDLTPEEAVFELEQLDHDFYLFGNLETGEDNVVHRIGNERYELLEPSSHEATGNARDEIVASPLRPSPMTAEEAIELLDLGDEPFVFFVDAGTRRGRIAYRRLDGHYGLIIAADEEG